MMRHANAVPVCLVLLGLGCHTQDPRSTLVPTSPFPTPPTQNVGVPIAVGDPVPQEQAARVNAIGEKLLKANPQIGVRPMFRTIGVPQPEIFHHGVGEIDITEGLVKQCATDGQLAAVLSAELGKMIAERELLAGPQARQPEAAPPINVPVGDLNNGMMNAPDLTNLAELGKWERQNRRPNNVPAPPPDPQLLARTYLTRAGYSVRELDEVGPMLQQATGNTTLARQLSGQTPGQVQRSWTTPQQN